MSQISCPHCGQTYQIPPDQWPQYQGRSITCTQCHQPFPVGVPLGAPPMGMHPGAYVPQPPAKSGGGMSVGLIIGIVAVALFVVVGILIAILLPALGRAREQARRVQCANNLRQVSLACIMYANSDRGRFPDKLERIVNGPLAQGLSTNVFVCPASTHTPSTNSGAQLAADLNSGTHLDYVYTGKGLRASSGMSAVVLYEPLEVHRGEGSNFAFADGHVEFIKKPKAQQMITELNRGVNPPKSASSPF